MLIIKHTVEIKASPETIWHIWQDVKNWNTWDSATEYSSLDGAFKEGTMGKWKAKGGIELPIKLTRVEPLKMAVVEFKLFLARIVVSYHLSESVAEKTRVTEQIDIKGPLAFLYAYHSSPTIKNNLLQGFEAKNNF
jgi:hypothetical protein